MMALGNPIKASLDPQRGLDPQVDNHYSKYLVSSFTVKEVSIGTLFVSRANRLVYLYSQVNLAYLGPLLRSPSLPPKYACAKDLVTSIVVLMRSGEHFKW